MSRFVLAVGAGVLAQAALLAAIWGLPHHHPATATTAFRVLTVGVVGGFFAATAAGRAYRLTGAAAGAVVGAGVGVAFWWVLFNGRTTGLLHHLHYALATSGVPDEFVVEIPRVVAAVSSLVVAAAFTVGGFLGGSAAARRP